MTAGSASRAELGSVHLTSLGEPVSTPDVVRALARAMNCPARLLAVPVGILQCAGTLLGKRAEVARLTGSLYVDSSAIRWRLGWKPPFSMDEGLAATVADMA